MLFIAIGLILYHERYKKFGWDKSRVCLIRWEKLFYDIWRPLILYK